MKPFFIKFKYYFEYIIFISIIKILKIFGIDKSASICSFIARKIGPLLPVTKVAKRNITNIMPQVTIDKTIDELWDNFGCFIGEFPFVNSLSEKEINKRIEIIGLENIEKFKKTKQPFLLFSGHFANWDFILRIMTRLYPEFGIVYRKANNPYVNEVINQFRSINNIKFIAKGPKGAKDLLKSIKARDAIAMLVDQRMSDGIEVPFFDIPAMTPYAIAKFALQFQYPIIPCQIIRTRGSYFKIIIYEQLSYAQTGDTTQDYYNIMFDINKILEEWIRQYPSQWFWFHNRWGKNYKSPINS